MPMWALNHWRWLVGVAAGLLLFSAGRWMGTSLMANPAQPAVVVEVPCPDERQGNHPSPGQDIAGLDTPDVPVNPPPGPLNDPAEPVPVDVPAVSTYTPQTQAARRDPAGDHTLGGLINLNTASAEELQSLPGIGPVLAQRIVAYREQWGPFQNVVDLLEVSGIGPRLLQRLEPHVTVGP